MTAYRPLAVLLVVALAASGVPAQSVAETRLSPKGTAAGDQLSFWDSVSVVGDVLVVGSPRATVDGLSSAGRVTVFRRSPSTGAWVETATITSDAPDALDEFGWATDLDDDGDLLVVGAPGVDSGGFTRGAVFVFRWDGAAWQFEQRIDSSFGEFGSFGGAVAVDGDVLVAGAPNADISGEQSAGGVTIHRWNGATWELDEVLFPTALFSGFSFGRAVDVDGDAIVVTTSSFGILADERAVVYRRDGADWPLEQQIFTPLTAADFGLSVTLEGDRLVVGAPSYDIGTTFGLGAAVVFGHDAGSWTQEQLLVHSSYVARDNAGWSVDLDGDTLVVGAAPWFDPGFAVLWEHDGTEWQEGQRFAASDGTDEDEFGASTSLDGGTLAVGAPRKDVDGAVDQGGLYVFDLEAWTDLAGGTGPRLVASGNLVGANNVSLRLTEAASNALGLAWISFGPTPFPALGGVVHAFPFANQVFVATDVDGDFSATTAWPVGVPGGTQVWFQMIVQDATSVHGLRLSNGLLATTP